jgi:hypothetical protein
MSDSLYMLRCSNRSYFARYTVILITSRDLAILFLYRCLRHFHTEYELRMIFHHLNFFKSDRNVSDCIFWKFFYKRKFFFLTHLLYAKSTFNSDRELYKKKWCDQMRTWFNFYWKIDSLFNFHRLLSRRRFIESIIIRFLKRRETEQICFWLMILSNRQLSFDR